MDRSLLVTSYTGTCLFDREGVEVQEVTPEGTVPVLQQGTNRIRFRSEDGDEFPRRVEVTVVRLGETIGR